MVRLRGLDALRGLAAASVVFFHVAALMQVGNFWGKEVVLGWYRAVPLFFMLSAFALCAGYDGRLAEAHAIRRYCWNRLLRIAPLFLAVMTTTIFFRAWIGEAFPSVVELIVNYTFVFNVVYGMHGSLVWGGWSIGTEVLFYIAFPFLLALGNSVARATVILATAIVVAFVFNVIAARIGLTADDFAYMNVLNQLPFFVAGILAYRTFQALPDGRRLVGTVLAIAAAVIFIWLFLTGAQNWSKLGFPLGLELVGIPLFCLLLAAATVPWKATNNIAADMLGKFSYGLYLWHPFVIVFIEVKTPIVQATSGLPPLVRFGVFGVVVFVTALITSIITYYLIERPALSLRRFRFVSGVLPQARPALGVLAAGSDRP